MNDAAVISDDSNQLPFGCAAVFLLRGGRRISAIQLPAMDSAASSSADPQSDCPATDEDASFPSSVAAHGLPTDPAMLGQRLVAAGFTYPPVALPDTFTLDFSFPRMCEICGSECNGLGPWKSHRAGQFHKTNALADLFYRAYRACFGQVPRPETYLEFRPATRIPIHVAWSGLFKALIPGELSLAVPADISSDDSIWVPGHVPDDGMLGSALRQVGKGVVPPKPGQRSKARQRRGKAKAAEEKAKAEEVKLPSRFSCPADLEAAANRQTRAAVPQYEEKRGKNGNQH